MGPDGARVAGLRGVDGAAGRLRRRRRAEPLRPPAHQRGPGGAVVGRRPAAQAADMPGVHAWVTDFTGRFGRSAIKWA